MASIDGHSFCARCHDKGKGSEPCIGNKDTPDCKFCNSLTPEQCAQLATPSYKLKKEKREPSVWIAPPLRTIVPLWTLLVSLLLGLLVNLLLPFFQPTNRPVVSSPPSERTGPDSSAAKQPSAVKFQPDRPPQTQVSSERTGPDVFAAKYQSAGKLRSILTNPSLQLQGALVQTMLLLSTSRSASLTPTDTDQLAFREQGYRPFNFQTSVDQQAIY